MSGAGQDGVTEALGIGVSSSGRQSERAMEDAMEARPMVGARRGRLGDSRLAIGMSRTQGLRATTAAAGGKPMMATMAMLRLGPGGREEGPWTKSTRRLKARVA
jgi:hypothetical protein